jgi:hypothetical protein
MSEQDNAVKIAVLETKIEGLREQSVAHYKTNQERFDRVDMKIDELVAVMNRGKGAYTASMIIAGAIGAFALKLLGALSSTFR